MTTPIDYNKMQNILDRRRYMGQIYTGKYETWQATELGLKTYGKWCDLIGWVNLTEQKWTSTADFMNLAIKRNWAEVVYDFKIKSNVCKQTKFGHDLFKTFEYWINEKAQKREIRKKKINHPILCFPNNSAVCLFSTIKTRKTCISTLYTFNRILNHRILQPPKMSLHSRKGR